MLLLREKEKKRYPSKIDFIQAQYYFNRMSYSANTIGILVLKKKSKVLDII